MALRKRASAAPYDMKPLPAFASGEPVRTILQIEKRHQPIGLGPRESFVEPLDRGASTSDHHVMLGERDAGHFGRRNNVAGIAARDPQDGAGAIGRDPEGGRGILRIARDAKPAVAIPANGGNIALRRQRGRRALWYPAQP